MPRKAEDGATSRRDFLKLAGVTAPAALAVASGGAAQAEALSPEEATGASADTAHRRAYYESARF